MCKFSICTAACAAHLILLLLGMQSCTSPTGAVVKYCEEYMSVCLSVRISPEPHAQYLAIFCMLPMSVARSSSGMLMISRIAYWKEGRVTALHSVGQRTVIYDLKVSACPKPG